MKKSVILADNSYTIRRIVELSFSDEEDIELISFENGLNINDKILEIKPVVVLADIKLPDTNGYEICKFINNTEELKDTKIFLIKGGFEPVDEDLLKDLKYEDFITKPFDSKALVVTIKNMLEEPAPPKSESTPEEIPSSIPEDIPEIDNLVEGADDIDFADIKTEMETDDLIAGDSSSEESLIREDVQPSEEITQGSEGEDKLSPETSDNIENPFEGDSSIISDEGSLTEEELKIKENIKLQEQELEIGSLTQEEIDIKKNIEKQKLQVDIDPLLDKKEGEEALPPEAGDTKLEIPETEEAKLDTPLDKIKTSDLENVFSISGEKEKPESEEKPETTPDIDISTEPVKEDIPESEITESVEDKADVEVKEEEKPVSEEKPETTPDTDISTEPVKEDIPESEITESVEDKVDVEVKEEEKPVVEEPEITVDEIPEITVTDELSDIPLEEKSKPEEEIKSELDSRISILNGLKDKDKIVEKVEDKLAVSIKEILWEITPPLAEKVIKNEIEKIKKEIEKEYSK